MFASHNENRLITLYQYFQTYRRFFEIKNTNTYIDSRKSIFWKGIVPILRVTRLHMIITVACRWSDEWSYRQTVFFFHDETSTSIVRNTAVPNFVLSHSRLKLVSYFSTYILTSTSTWIYSRILIIHHM